MCHDNFDEHNWYLLYLPWLSLSRLLRESDIAVEYFYGDGSPLFSGDVKMTSKP